MNGEHTHEWSALSSHFGEYGDQDAHYHVCLCPTTEHPAPGYSADCRSMLVGAVRRDASGYRTHRLTTGSGRVVVTQWHITRDGGITTACGRSGAEFTFCDDLASIHQDVRCQRPGCKQGWPT